MAVKIRTEIVDVSFLIYPDDSGHFAIPYNKEEISVIDQISEELDNIDGVKVQYDPHHMALEWCVTVEIRNKESLEDVANRIDKEFKKIWKKHVKNTVKGKKFNHLNEFQERLQSFGKIKNEKR
jgi:hypothetical protein